MSPASALVKNSTRVWHPASLTEAAEGREAERQPYSVIILNVPIQDRRAFVRLCRGAETRACADGGANRVRDLALSAEEEQQCSIDVICGDMDSVRDDVLEYYKKRSANIVVDRDQNSTDLQKTLRHLAKRFEEDQHRRGGDIAILGGLGGRADQAFSQIHYLYVEAQRTPKSVNHIYLVTSTALIFVLERGLNVIHTPVRDKVFAESVGIVPLSRPAVLTTTGFEWNLNGEELEFGRFISTSNHLKKDVVEVETTEPVIFTLEFA